MTCPFAGPYYFALARGMDDRFVCGDRARKSVGAETTFHADIFTAAEARAALGPLIAKVWSHCEGAAIRGRTATLKAKFTDFQRMTRSRTVDLPVASQAELEELVSALLEPLFPSARASDSSA